MARTQRKGSRAESRKSPTVPIEPSIAGSTPSLTSLADDTGRVAVPESSSLVIQPDNAVEDMIAFDYDLYEYDQDKAPVFPPVVRVFVVMPFGNKEEYQGGNEEAEFVFSEIIKPGVEQAFEGAKTQLIISREVDKAESGSITTSIVHSLVKSDVVVVDVTGHNANVFLELGIRYALRGSLKTDLRAFGAARYHGR
jgi:hypothetical protein